MLDDIRFDALLDEVGKEFLCEGLRLLAVNLCRSGYDADMKDWDSPARRSGSKGVIFSHLQMSTYGQGASLLERYGIAHSVNIHGYKEGYSPDVQMDISAIEISPDSVKLTNSNVRDLANVFVAAQTVLDQSCLGPDAEFYPMELKRQMQRTGVNSGYLTAIPVRPLTRKKLEKAHRLSSGEPINDVYFWTSKMLGKPYDTKLEKTLPDTNFWETVYPSFVYDALADDPSVFRKVLAAAMQPIDDGMREIHAERWANPV
ncbi:hypothetical protein [Yoonia sp. BS5-3]|uniref:Uncharacterized protein n=1 Tax=Yoonia phaeophyticola TaxID=3137369 RepID=A0ABZ2V5Y7_9RHOB